MNFAEFREKHDHYDAYASWLSVKSAKEKNIIPIAYHKYFPDRCDCGSENMITNNLKRITCCDPKCYHKEACQMSEFMRRSGIERFGVATCEHVLSLFRHYDEKQVKAGKTSLFETKSFLDIFAVPEENWPFDVTSALCRDFAAAIDTLMHDSITFPGLISRLGVESLGSNALNVFDGISNSKELLQEIDRCGGVRLYCFSRGVYAPEVINNIYESLIDIANAEFLFKSSLRMQGLITVDICVTGSSSLYGESLTKAQLVDALNNASVGKLGHQYYEFHLCTALQSASFILYTTPSNSAKFRAGQARGEITDEFGTHPVLMQVDDFYDLLKERMQSLDKEVVRLDG